MLRIDTSTALANAFGAGKNGFQDGNPSTATPATALDANWFNAIQEELANAIESFGVTLNPALNNQLSTILHTFSTTGGSGSRVNFPYCDTKVNSAPYRQLWT